MNIKKMIPFLDDESLSLFVEKIKEGKISTTDAVFTLPFLKPEQIKGLSEQIINQKIQMKLEVLLPFMDDESIEELYNKVLNQEITTIDEATLMPFLKPEKIKSLFMDYINNL